MRNVLDKVVGKIKTHILCLVTFFVYLFFFLENRAPFFKKKIIAEKYGRAGQTTDYITAHAHLHARYLRLQTHTHNM
jgi:hypothetical protein